MSGTSIDESQAVAKDNSSQKEKTIKHEKPGANIKQEGDLSPAELMKRQIVEEQREARNLDEINGIEKIRWEIFLR